MVLQRFTLRNFKGLQQLKIDFTKLNVFVGENGTGKSTVVQGLSVIKKSLNTAGINTDLPYLNLGPLHNIVPPGEKASLIVEGEKSLDLTPLSTGPVSFRLEVQFDVQGLLRYETEIMFAASPPLEVSVKSSWTRYGAMNVEPKLLQLSGFGLNLLPTNIIGRAFQPGGYSIPPGMKTESSQQMGHDLSQSLERLSTVISQSLGNAFVVPLFRGLSEPLYPLQPSPSADLNPRAGLIQMGTALASNLAYLDREGKSKIREWMNEVMGVDIDWRPVPGGQIAIQNPATDTFFVNEGFGSNQLTFILEEIARTDSGSFIAVEEPEIHLHPDAQFRFGQLMSRIVEEEGKQILLVTHSEHIVSAILTSIRQEIITPKDVSIWYFEKKDGKISASKAEVDDQGHTKGGLTTFIETAIKELKEYAK